MGSAGSLKFASEICVLLAENDQRSIDETKGEYVPPLNFVLLRSLIHYLVDRMARV